MSATQLKTGDRVVLSRLKNEDEEYFQFYLNEEGTVLSVVDGTYPCVWVQFDKAPESNEIVFVNNIDKIDDM